ncbi:hypothetical protein SLE2022_004770 [Rubroshorea leprosula]
MPVSQVYTRRVKLTQMGKGMEEEGEDEAGKCWMPGTPKKQSPVKLQNVYLKRQSREHTNSETKANSSDGKSCVFDRSVSKEHAEKGVSLSPASMTFSDEKSCVLDRCVVAMVGKEGTPQSPMNTSDEKGFLFNPCTATIGKEEKKIGPGESTGMIDLNKSIWGLNDDADSAYMDSGEQEMVLHPDQKSLHSFDLPKETNNSVELCCAPISDSRDTWKASMTHNVLAGECFVLSANQFCPRKQNLSPLEHVFSGPDELGPETVVCAGHSNNVLPSGETVTPADLDDRQTLKEGSTPRASQDKKTRKKPKRKRHRPKVVVDVGPKKNTINPKLATPKKAKEKKPSQRRKNVRKTKDTKDKRSHPENFRSGGTNSKLVDTYDYTCHENITIISVQGSTVPVVQPNDLPSSNCLQLAEAEQLETLTARASGSGKLAAKTSKKRSRRRRKLNLFSNLWPSTARRIGKKRKVIVYGWRSVNGVRSNSRRSKRKPSLKFTPQGLPQAELANLYQSENWSELTQQLEVTNLYQSENWNRSPVASPECNHLEQSIFNSKLYSFENPPMSIPPCNDCPRKEFVFEKLSSPEKPTELDWVAYLNTASNLMIPDAYALSSLCNSATGDWFQFQRPGTQEVSSGIPDLPVVLATPCETESQRFWATHGIIPCQERIPYQFSFARSAQEVLYEDDLKLVIQKLQSLRVSDKVDKLSKQNKNARQKKNKNARGKKNFKAVPHPDQGAHGAVVPFKHGEVVPYLKPNKKKIWPKVVLDSETLRLWKWLMITDGTKTEEEYMDEEMDEEKKKYWKAEREKFHRWVEVFIARLHLVLGNRAFHKWNGSVTDSVGGVFLTQNVSDHLSSSAFIRLRSRFSPKSKASNENREITSSLESVGSNSDGSQYFVSEPEPERRRNLGNFADASLVGMVEEPSLIQIEDITSNSSPCHQEELMSSSQTIPNHEPGVTESQNTKPQQNYDTMTQSKKRKRVGTKKVKEQDFSGKEWNAEKISTAKGNNKGVKENKVNSTDWDALRRMYSTSEPRSKDQMDSVDWEAVRQADIHQIADAIRDRGQQIIIAGRIKDFLNRLVELHGTTDLEWLRNVPPDKAKEYLLEIRGLGLKSVECVRLLTLQNVAFPVDTNVGRIAVRLGWVPLQPLPEELQIHLLEEYPVMDSIQKYLWPRLCTLDQETLYELHYQLITFGKVFCTKRNPNCNACPMRGDCRHFASAFASARLALPGPSDKRMVSSAVHTVHKNNPISVPELPESGYKAKNLEPIIEEPIIEELPSHVLEAQESEEPEIEYDSEGIPIIKLSAETFRTNIQDFMDKKFQDGIGQRALVALNPIAASIPARKLKDVSRLRSEHQVYELPPGHPLLEGFERDPDDRYNYHLAIWRPGETADSTDPPQKTCDSEGSDLCNDQRCFSCNNIREQNSNVVRATFLIPYRTALKGSFPLNGTYFQTNEVFADHQTSIEPIYVSRDLIYNLKRRTAYFGTSAASILRGVDTKGIQQCFWKGIICVRGFDRKTRAPRRLVNRLHCSEHKLGKKGKVKLSDE